MENGANLRCKDENGQTPFHIAMRKGKYDTVAILLMKEPNIKTEVDKDTEYFYKY